MPTDKIGSVDFDGSADITLDQIGCDYVVEDTIGQGYTGHIKYASGRMVCRGMYFSTTVSGFVVHNFSANFINSNVVGFCNYRGYYGNPAQPYVRACTLSAITLYYPTIDVELVWEAWGRWK